MDANNKSWDTHIHILDHERFPFKPDRLYTPQSANLRSAIEASDGCQNFVLVQASMENGSAGILHHLRQAKEQYPDRVFRAEIFWDGFTASGGNGSIDDLHQEGVRCLRLHAEFGNGSTSLEWVINSLRDLCRVARQRQWAVAAQLPLELWLGIAPHLAPDSSSSSSASDPLRDSSIRIIAEHWGSSPPVPLTPAQMACFESFVSLLAESSRFYVKLTGMHRRLSASATIEDLVPLVALLAERVPDKLLYGSDYPHVDVETISLMPTPLLSVDRREEVSVLKRAMPEVCWQMCLCENPKIFL